MEMISTDRVPLLVIRPLNIEFDIREWINKKYIKAKLKLNAIFILFYFKWNYESSIIHSRPQRCVGLRFYLNWWRVGKIFRGIRREKTSSTLHVATGFSFPFKNSSEPFFSFLSKLSRARFQVFDANDEFQGNKCRWRSLKSLSRIFRATHAATTCCNMAAQQEKKNRLSVEEVLRTGQKRPTWLVQTSQGLPFPFRDIDWL